MKKSKLIPLLALLALKLPMLTGCSDATPQEQAVAMAGQDATTNASNALLDFALQQGLNDLDGFVDQGMGVFKRYFSTVDELASALLTRRVQHSNREITGQGRQAVIAEFAQEMTVLFMREYKEGTHFMLAGIEDRASVMNHLASRYNHWITEILLVEGVMSHSSLENANAEISDISAELTRQFMIYLRDLDQEKINEAMATMGE